MTTQPPKTLANTIEEITYQELKQIQPSLLVAVGQLLDKGQTPQAIAKQVGRQSVFLAGLVEMAAVYMQTTGER